MAHRADGMNDIFEHDVCVRERLKAKEFSLTDSVWDDQQVSLGSVGFGASAPSWTAYKGSKVLAFNKAQDNSIDFLMQLSHRYKVGTPVEFHLHVVAPSDIAGDVKWNLTISKADIGADFPAESSYSLTQTIAAGSADEHNYADISEDIGSSSGVSSVWICSLTREGTALVDNFDDDVYLVALDAHFEIDSLGSREETTK